MGSPLPTGSILGHGECYDCGMEKVNLREKFSLFSEHWTPKVAGELNGQQVKLVKFIGPFEWHHHDGEDELFLVVKGRFKMELRDGDIWLEEGEFIIVPRGVEHRLAQIVCQIIKTVGWENDFKIEGLETLADFSSLVNEVESLDPISQAVHPSSAGVVSRVLQKPQAFSVVRFAQRMDALFDLLDATADALAATWDQREETMASEIWRRNGDVEPTVQ